MDRPTGIEILFTDSGSVDIEAVAKRMKPFLLIQKDEIKMILTEQGSQLNVSDKILMYGIGRKLLKLTGYVEIESFSAKNIADEFNLKKGSVDPSFKGLKSKSYIIGAGSKYVVLNEKINQILTTIEGESNGK